MNVFEQMAKDLTSKQLAVKTPRAPTKKELAERAERRRTQAREYYHRVRKAK